MLLAESNSKFHVQGLQELSSYTRDYLLEPENWKRQPSKIPGASASVAWGLSAPNLAVSHHHQAAWRWASAHSSEREDEQGADRAGLRLGQSQRGAHVSGGICSQRLHAPMCGLRASAPLNLAPWAPLLPCPRPEPGTELEILLPFFSHVL